MNLKKSVFKTALLSFLIALVLIPVTNSSFVDEEKAMDNVFTAGVLDFSLDNEAFSPDTINPGEAAEKMVVLNNNSSINMEYKIRGYKTGGDTDFCNSLNITAKLNGVEKYSGLLFSMTPAFNLTATDSIENWQFIISFSDTSISLENKTCEFDIEFYGQQIGGAGFSDTETINNVINSGDWTAPEAPVTLGFNSTYLDYSTRPVEIGCGGTVSQNQVSHHWEKVAGAVEYQRQWVFPGGDPNNEENWHGAENWTTPYTNYRTFGGNPGIEGIWYFRVRVRDAAGNWSEYSSPCSLRYEKGLQQYNPDYGVVINEVFYDVDDNHGDEDDNPHNDEWVELYNTTNQEISLHKWSLTDNNKTTTINANIKIPAHGFVVLAKAAQTWTYWNIPSSAVKHPLGQNIGNGLSNSGDRLILKDSNGNEVDKVSWGTDSTVFNPAVGDVAEGHSIMRNPLGQDTDTAADWTDNSNPNPGTNPHSHIHVDLDNDESNLLVSFENASGFDLVKYSIGYEHLYKGKYVSEKISGEKKKDLNNETLELEPKYFGTCSSKGEVCTSHKDIKNVIISLMYKNGKEIIGTSQIDYDWRFR